MKKGIWILTLLLLLLSCGKEGQVKDMEYDDVETPVGEQIVSDSIVSSTQVETSKAEDAKGSTGRVISSSKNYDNMRGFDPASEDDMDDNCMSRYMENTDERRMGVNKG